MKDIKGLLLDVDGVISRGGKPIERAVEGYKLLKEHGIKTIFVSNNSTRSRRFTLERFRNFGLDVGEDEIVIATHATARLIANEKPGAKVYTTGEEGLKEELRNEGLEIVKYTEAEYLVVGSNRGINFQIFTEALRLALRKEVRYVAVNPDKVFPAEDGPIPGTGLIIGALYWMTGREPDAVVGKPSPIIMEQALEKIGLDKEDVAIVGDQLDIDIMAGKNVGIKTILVLSGVTTRENYKEMVEKYGVEPDYIFEDLYEVAQILISEK